jgi:hypothetical protein
MMIGPVVPPARAARAGVHRGSQGGRRGAGAGGRRGAKTAGTTPTTGCANPPRWCVGVKRRREINIITAPSLTP